MSEPGLTYMFYMTLMMSQLMKTKTTKLRQKRSTQLLMTCQNLQNKLLNITVLFIWYLLASLKKMSLAKHDELYFILVSTCFSPLAILASVWKKWFSTLYQAFTIRPSDYWAFGLSGLRTIGPTPMITWVKDCTHKVRAAGLILGRGYAHVCTS